MEKLILIINLARALNEDLDNDDCSDDSTSEQAQEEVNKVKKIIKPEPPPPLQHDITTTEGNQLIQDVQHSAYIEITSIVQDNDTTNSGIL